MQEVLPTKKGYAQQALPVREWNYQPRRLATRAKEKKKKPGSSAAAAGSDAKASESGHPAPGPRRHAVEVAKLGKGDIVNGLCLLGKTPQFHVVAHTKVKALSFETETCEVALGPQLFARMCKLVQAKHNWCQERVLRSLAVRKALGTNSILTKKSEDPVLRASAMAHFLDHYVPQGMQGTSSAGAKERKSPKPSSVSLAPIAPTAPEDGQDAHLPPEFSGIKSLVVRGKEPPPPPPVFPWNSTNSPAHHANFREAVVSASAEAATASNAIMGASAAASGTQAPSFMQELFVPSDAGNQESSKLHEEPWTGHPPSGWPLAGPLFAGQVCTTFLDLNTARTLRSVYARYKASSPKSKETGSRLCTPPKSPPPRSPLSRSSQESQQPAGGRHSPNQASNPATGVLQAEKRGSPHTANRGDVVDSATSQRPARGASTGSLPPMLLPGLPGSSVLEDRALNGVPGVGQGAAGQRGSRGSGGVREHEKGDLSKSWAAGMGAGSGVESGLKGRRNTVHSSMDLAAAMEAWSSSPVAGWRPSERQQHAGGDPDLMANKGTLPHLPNAPSPMLVSDNLKQRMLQQPASSFATARYVKKRTATLVSNGARPDQELQAMPFSKAARPVAPLSSPPPYGATQDGSVLGPAYHSSPFNHPPAQSYSSPAAPPAASATGALQQNQLPAQRRSQAALGASLLKAPGGGSATALGLSDHGFDEEGVIILPHMMSIYDGVLDNERGFLKHVSKHAQPPHARWKSQPQPPPVSAFQYKPFVQGLLNTRKGAFVDGEQQDSAEDHSLAAKESASSLQATFSQNSVHKHDDPKPSLSSLASLKTLQRSSSKRADEPTLPLDRDAYAPPLQDHTISDPTHEDINYILHRWGARWQEERVEAIRRRQRRQLQQQLQEGRSDQAPILPPIGEKAEGDRLTPESRLTPEFKQQEEDLAAFGMPCVHSWRTLSFYDPDTPR
ncbi:hypothetical protein DUNSADRAFT_11152 [Dunaliella salina]|uniref:Cyclic nucleotide-binding domain-containing protein n=1 Tax=Dunaliella salina TaxID=3046 RepID=A0ABQ7GE11_DUNSA|nr:hypothetical protein DUNSADRAFT_11152 [Dunaliella salina]|eukprot:KAF5832850.1 hypothetical protein DUNSADRAFT_11152 [Dunaliella salina]